MEDNMCPICLYPRDIGYTECNHGYCVSCLSRITTCAICRKPLLRHRIYNLIKYKKVDEIEPVLHARTPLRFVVIILTLLRLREFYAMERLV